MPSTRMSDNSSNCSRSVLSLPTTMMMMMVANSSNATFNVRSSCLRHGQHLLNTSVLSMEDGRRWMLDLTLSISVVALATSLVIYLIVHELRTVPGKCLMGLIVSELLFNISILVATFLQHHDYVDTLPCFVVSVVIHYLFLSIILWTNVIAIDLIRKFRNPTRKLHHFKRYLYVSYLIPLVFVSIALVLDLDVFGGHDHDHHDHHPASLCALKPHYGVQFCSISSINGVLVFLTAPLTLSFAINIIIFSVAIYKFKQITTEIAYIQIYPSIKERFFIYGKLSILLGIFSLAAYFGILVVRNELFNYYSALFSSLHGFFVFVAFTCKPKIWRLLSKHVHSWQCKLFTFAH